MSFDIIKLLPDSVANQIAAGEVIQRPASVVKELMENALDAGATQIDLFVKDAGRTMITVIDNGHGMSETDARLCFERHATSKIKKAEDLFMIRTMGFRGEALASIAAVAQVELMTRREDDELGTKILIEGSVVKEQLPKPMSVGTNFTVKAGDIMYLANGEHYSLYINEEYKFIFCDFEFDSDIPRKSAFFTPKHDSSAEKLFVRLLNVYNAQNKTYFTDALSLIYSIYSEIIATRSDFYITKSVKTKILETKKYIDTHHSDSALGISELSSLADMSDVYFRKLFKAEVGTSPAKYIISVRLKKAKQLMKYYPFLTLEECAKQSGFSSLQYFSRVFKNEFGITPSKYRSNRKFW